MEGPTESEDHPPSASEVVQQTSEEAVRVAEGTVQNVDSGSNNRSSSTVGRPPQAHRRVQSEIVGTETVEGRGGHVRSNSFQKLRTSVQRAFQKGGNKEEINLTSFNPEVLANQKRQWYQIHNKKLDLSIYKEPTSLFEHFFIVGLPPDANLKAVEDVFAKRKIWEANMRKAQVSDIKMLRYLGPDYPMLEPQILFGYPPGKKLALQNELTAFCFPEGVQARLMEKTPSMSDLNAAIHGQEHRGRDDLSFIFSLKGADNTTLYGVCLHVEEIVQRSPGIIRGSLSRCSGGFSRFLVLAPRCYCVLTRCPLFELHYEMLNSIITQERLNRITQFVSQMNIIDYVPSPLGTQDRTDGSGDSSIRKHSTDWTAFAIPVDSAGVLTAAAAGIIPDDEVGSFSSRLRESETPESAFTSEPSDIDQATETDKESRKIEQQCDDNTSQTLETDCNDREQVCAIHVNGHSSPETKTSFGVRRESSESLLSSVRSIGSEDEDEEVSSLFDKNAGDDAMMKWANKENKNELLQIVCCYHALPLPPYGGEIKFQPLEYLQAITYIRPPISSFGPYGIPPDINLQDTIGSAEVSVRLAAAEEVFSLSLWTTATVCRVLSLDSILAIFAGVLLEKQVLVVCPNLGVLSAVVLSLIPMIHPFEWQSLFLPILPRKLLEFLDAPVPFIVGIQNKPADLKLKTTNLIYVDVIKDKVTICYMPRLPHYKELLLELLPIHSRLSRENSVAKRSPVYKCNEVQAEASREFLNVMRRYTESLCSDLRSHTITSVQSNCEKVALLFKDSFIDSFPVKDRPFVKLLVDTQLFSVLSDSFLSSYEHE